MDRQRFIILLALIGAWVSAAAQVSFTLIPPRNVIEGQKFTLTLRLTNGRASDPKAPELANCRLLYGPSTSTMHSTQIINGQTSSKTTIDYSFTYLAEKAGDVEVPSLSVSVDGKKYSTSVAHFTILPPDKNAANASGGAGVPSQVAPNGELEVSADDMFVRISLNKSRVYEQEPVVATVKVYTRYNISSFRVLAQPTFEGFLSEELEVNSNTEMEHYNGKNYYTAVLKKCILYPQKTGQLKITSGKFDVTLVGQQMVSNGFFSTPRRVEKQMNTQSNTATVDVVALPQPQPAGFNNAVGNYTANVEMKPTEMRTNEAASYILTVQGTGNIKYLTLPKLDVPVGIDQYTPKADIDAHFNGANMQGIYSVNYTLVPQEPGNFEIPAWKFVYFNPADKQYHTIDLRAFDIRVAQGAGMSQSVEQKSIAKGMTDILHIKPITGQLSQTQHYVFRSWGYWLLYIVAAVALVAIVGIYRRQIKLNADVQGRRLARANKEASRRFKQARSYMAAHDSEKFYASLNQAMSGYLSDKLGIPASQLVRDNISAQLAQRGYGEEAIDNVIYVLDECEMARFTPEHTDTEMSQLLDRAVAAVKSIENKKK